MNEFKRFLPQPNSMNPKNFKTYAMYRQKLLNRDFILTMIISSVIAAIFIISEYQAIKKYQDLESKYILIQNKKILEKFIYNDFVKLIQILDLINTECTISGAQQKNVVNSLFAIRNFLITKNDQPLAEPQISIVTSGANNFSIRNDKCAIVIDRESIEKFLNTIISKNTSYSIISKDLILGTNIEESKYFFSQVYNNKLPIVINVSLDKDFYNKENQQAIKILAQNYLIVFFPTSLFLYIIIFFIEKKYYKKLKLSLQRTLSELRKYKEKTIFYEELERAEQIAIDAEQEFTLLVLNKFLNDTQNVKSITDNFSILDNKPIIIDNFEELFTLIANYFAKEKVKKNIQIECEEKIISNETVIPLGKEALFQIIIALMANRVFFLTDRNFIKLQLFCNNQIFKIELKDNGIPAPNAIWNSELLNSYKNNNPFILSWQNLENNLIYYGFQYQYVKKNNVNSFIIEKQIERMSNVINLQERKNSSWTKNV